MAAPVLSIGNEKDTGQIVLKWDKDPSAISYQIFRSDSENGPFIHWDSTKSTVYIDRHVQPGTACYYYIQAFCAEGTSPASSVQRGIKKLCSPSPVFSEIRSDGSFQISWTDVDHAISYALFDSSNGSAWTLLERIEGTHYTAAAPEPGSMRFYRVQALATDPAASSLPSSAQKLTNRLDAPEVYAEPTTEGKIKLFWSPSKNADRYNVYTAQSADGPYRLAAVTTQTCYVHPYTDADTTYYYKVQAVASNAEASSDDSSIKAAAGQYTAELSLAGALNSEGKPLLWWGRIPNAVHFLVERSLLPDQGFSIIKHTDNAYFTNAGAAEGVTYYYKVAAYDANGSRLADTAPVAVTSFAPEDETFETRYVLTPRINLYTAPSKDSSAHPVCYMSELQLGKAILSGKSGTWHRVLYNNELYYLHIKKDQSNLTSVKSSFQYAGSTVLQQQVLNTALDLYRNEEIIYLSGGDGWIDENTLGFDCSGFAVYVLTNAMRPFVPTYSLVSKVVDLAQPHSIYNAGLQGEFRSYEVSVEDLQPGDVLIFSSQQARKPANFPGHCGIYLGNQEFIHCTDVWENGVCIMPLQDEFKDTFLKAVRYLPVSIEAACRPMIIAGDDQTYPIYEKMAADSAVLAELRQGEALTVVFAGNQGWAYVRTQEGVEGFFPLKYLVQN